MKSNQANNQLRIIAGTWRGRKLSFPPVAGLRPTPDRVRETLFNWLDPLIRDKRCLDLFAGSGALGIEAASRGAAEVVLVDDHPRVAETLREQLQLLKATQVQVVQADVGCRSVVLGLGHIQRQRHAVDARAAAEAAGDVEGNQAAPDEA